MKVRNGETTVNPQTGKVDDVRAPYNTTANLITGPGMVPPNSVFATVPARFVEETDTPILSGIDGKRSAYVTLDGPAPTAPPITTLGQTLSMDFDFGDRIEIPAGSGNLYTIIFVERMNPPFGAASYYRAHVCPHPFPA